MRTFKLLNVAIENLVFGNGEQSPFRPLTPPPAPPIGWESCNVDSSSSSDSSSDGSIEGRLSPLQSHNTLYHIDDLYLYFAVYNFEFFFKGGGFEYAIYFC